MSAEAAEAEYTLVIDLYPAGHEDVRLAYMYFLRGRIRQTGGRMQDAEVNYDCAVGLYESAQDNLGLAMTHGARAVVLFFAPTSTEQRPILLRLPSCSPP